MRCRRYPLHQYSFPKPLSILDHEVERLKTGGGLVGWRAGWLDGLGLEGPHGWEPAGGAGGLELEGLGLEGWKRAAKARTCSVPFHQRGLEGWTVGVQAMSRTRHAQGALLLEVSKQCSQLESPEESRLCTKTLPGLCDCPLQCR